MTQKLQGGLKWVWPKIRDGEIKTRNLEGINSYSLTEKKLSGVVDRKIQTRKKIIFVRELWRNEQIMPAPRRSPIQVLPQPSVA